MSKTSSSTVCQNLQSCLDPYPFESRDSSHQLTPSKQALSFRWPNKQTETQSSKTEQAYVHPLVKRSSSSLSPLSLEMCTESLGSETGNDVVSNLDDFSSHHIRQNKPTRNQEFAQKIKKIGDFPPPLTSITGNEGVQVKTHREGGRLVIKAFNFSSTTNFFRAERENGRLKLSLIKDDLKDSEGGDEEEENKEDIEEEKVNEGENGSDDEADFNGCYWGENNGGKIECKINGGDWSGGSGRCNEERSRGAKRLPSLPYCVAIS